MFCPVDSLCMTFGHRSVYSPMQTENRNYDWLQLIFLTFMNCTMKLWKIFLFVTKWLIQYIKDGSGHMKYCADQETQFECISVGYRNAYSFHVQFKLLKMRQLFQVKTFATNNCRHSLCLRSARCDPAWNWPISKKIQLFQMWFKDLSIDILEDST